MDERITIILAVTISYVIICIIIGSRISKNYFSKYLKGNRVKILKGEIPEMNYDPDRNILNRKTIEREYKTSAVQTNISMHKYLGNMTFSGKYKDIHIEDSLFSHVYPTRSHPSNEHHRHHPSDYFEQIMVYCDIPSDSILNELQYVRFYRTDSLNYKFGTTINNVLNKAINFFGGTNTIDIYDREDKWIYTLENSNIRAEFNNNVNKEQWMYFLEHGLGKKLYEIISEYGIGGFRRYENKLFIVMKSSETKDYLFYENTDYFANHIGRVCKAVKCLYSLLRWSDVSDDDSSDSLSAVDERCKEYENGKGRIYSAEQKPVDIDSRIFGTCMSIFFDRCSYIFIYI